MLTLLSKLYGRIVANRNYDYNTGAKKTVKVTVPVISVGNITSGGTGKTPMVQFIVRELQKEGYSPAVILRGYRRKGRGLGVVHDGEKILCDVHESGDEAMLHAVTLNVPVVVCKHKVDAAIYVAGRMDADIIVADDAFQHRALHRDADVVLVNSQTYTDALIPRGRLREPLSSLDRADIIVNTETDLDYSYTWKSLTNTGWVDATTKPATKLVATCAIANPQRFVGSLQEERADVVATILLKDHARFSSDVVANMIKQARLNHADLVVTTKDAVKLVEWHNLFVSNGIQVYVLDIELRNSQVLRNVMMVIASKIVLFNQDYDEDCSVQSLGQ